MDSIPWSLQVENIAHTVTNDAGVDSGGSIVMTEVRISHRYLFCAIKSQQLIQFIPAFTNKGSWKHMKTYDSRL